VAGQPVRENSAITEKTEETTQKPPAIRSRGPSLPEPNDPQISLALTGPFAKDKSLFASPKIGTTSGSTASSASTHPETKAVTSTPEQPASFLFAMEVQASGGTCT
jgi:hypothetical protein